MLITSRRTEYFKVDFNDFDTYCNVIVLTVADDNNNELMGKNLSLFAPPKQLQLPSPIITVVSIEVYLSGTAEIMLHSNKLALYVFLSCQVKGQFEDNAFFMEPNKLKVCCACSHKFYLAYNKWIGI